MRDLGRDGVELPKTQVQRRLCVVQSLGEGPLVMSASPVAFLGAVAALLLPASMPASMPVSTQASNGASLTPVLRAALAHSGAVVLQGRPQRASERMVLRQLASQRAVPRMLRPTVVAVAIDQDRLLDFTEAGGGILEDVPLGPFHEVALELVPIRPFEADARIEASRPAPGARGLRALETAAVPFTGAFLVGKVEGIDDSHAFLASSEAGVYGYVEIPGRTYLISSGPYGSGLPTVSYDLAGLPDGVMQPPEWTCETPDAAFLEDSAAQALAEGGVAGAPPPCRQVRVAYDTDYEFLQRFGGDTAAASGYVATLASALTAIYSRDVGVRVSASYLRLWPEPADPWTATGTLEQLVQFKSVWDSTMIPIQRDLAHMLSGRSLGGGIAYRPGLCASLAQSGNTNAGYGLSANLSGYFPTPLVDNDGQNWDLFVVAHELGHNFGAYHTHEVNPLIDGCGLSPQDCGAANANNGTIMSYCHTCAGGLSNIQLRFHPQSADVILARLNSISCNYLGTARNPIAVADTANAYTGIPVVIDVLANDIEFNCETVEIGGFNATTFAGATISRSVGTGVGGRDELLYTMSDPAYAATDVFSYTLLDASGQTSTGSASIEVSQLREPENPSNTSAQLDVAYYALTSPTVLPNFAALTPYATDVVPAIDFAKSSSNVASSGRADNVGAVFEGWLDVPASGGWTFTLESDEGSKLWIGDTLVVSHDGMHAMTARSGVVGLAVGRHALRVEYFERTGSAGLVASWAGPGVATAVIPAEAFARGGTDSPADFDNDSQVGAGDLSLLLSVWNTANDTYDLTGDGLVNAQDLAALLFEWAY